MRTAKIFLPALMTMMVAGGAVCANDALAARADKTPPPPPQGMAEMERPCPPMPDCPGMRGMQLTPEQREKVQKLYAESDKRIQPLRDQLFVKKQELKAMQKATNPDVPAVSKKAQEIVDLQNQIRAERTALGEQLDKELGLKPGTHSFMGRHRGPGKGDRPCN